MSQTTGQAGETLVGAIVLAVAVGFLVFAVARAGAPTGGGGYPLRASFDRADGLQIGADVRLSGVKVGTVSEIDLDPVSYQAVATLSVADEVLVPVDSTARVAMDGLLGGAYVAIEPGGAEETLITDGAGEIELTQGSVDLITLFARFASGSGSESEGGGSADGDPNAAEDEELVP